MNSSIYQIEPLLQKLGLNKTEQSVYLAGLVLGPSSIMQLATQSKQKRLTTHQAVESLIAQGVFIQSYYGKKRLVYPTNSNGLQLLLEEKKFALRQLEQELESSKHIFDYITHARNSFSNTRLYHGIEGINTTLLEIAKDKESVCTIYDSNSLGTLVDDKIFHRSYSQRAKYKIQSKLILPENFKDVWHLERKEDYEVSLRVLANQQIIQGGIEIRGKKIALHCYKEGFITTTIIENKEIAQILLVMYNALRQQAKDYQEKYLLI